MRKKRISKPEAGRLFAERLAEQFPGIHSRVLLETVEGEDLTVRTEIPEELGDIYLDVVNASGELRVDFADDYGLYIATMTIDLADQEKEAVHG